MTYSIRITTGLMAGASQARSEVALAARRMPTVTATRLGHRSLGNAAVSSASAPASAVPSTAAESPVAAPDLTNLIEFVSSAGPEALKAAEKAAAKAAKKTAKAKAKKNNRFALNSQREAESSSSSSSSSESDSESDEEEGGESQMIDVATLAVSLSRLGKRQKRRKANRSFREATSSSTLSALSSTPSTSSSFDPDAAALTVMHTLSGSIALSAPFVDGEEGQAPTFAVCVGPDCSRLGSQEVAAQLALAEKKQGGGGSPSRQVVRCGCLGECGGRKGRLARGATAGKVEVDEAEAAKAFERSLAPLV